MAEICYLDNRHDGWFDLDKISQTGAEWHVDCGDMVKIKTRCRIPIWRTFGRIQWHVISEPLITFRGAATWRIQCRDPRFTCHMQGAATWRIQCPDPSATCHIAGCKNFIRHIENRYSPYFICFFYCSLSFDKRRLSYRLRYLFKIFLGNSNGNWTSEKVLLQQWVLPLKINNSSNVCEWEKLTNIRRGRAYIPRTAVNVDEVRDLALIFLKVSLAYQEIHSLSGNVLSNCYVFVALS